MAEHLNKKVLIISSQLFGSCIQLVCTRIHTDRLAPNKIDEDCGWIAHGRTSSLMLATDVKSSDSVLTNPLGASGLQAICKPVDDIL